MSIQNSIGKNNSRNEDNEMAGKGVKIDDVISSENIIKVCKFCNNCKNCRLGPHEDAVKYDRTYRALLQAGKDCFDHLKDDKEVAVTYIKILALATYGWMPTILGRHGEMGYGDDNNENDNTWDGKIFEAVKKINNTPTVDCLRKTDDELRKENNRELGLNNFIDNSYVGLSKFLHFMLPDKFAIWDSNVYRALIIANQYDDLKNQTLKIPKTINANDQKAFEYYENAIITATEKNQCSA